MLAESLVRMPRRVMAIGFDSVDLNLLDRFFHQGELPHLRRLRSESFVAPVKTTVDYAGGSVPYASTEGNWVMFQTGVRPATSGYWETITFDPHTYRSTNDFTHGGYDFKQFPPFYALGNDYDVATFDVPVSAVVPNLRGEQIVGWGGHFPYVVRGSQPAELLKQLTSRHGRNGVLYRDHGVPWNQRYLRWLEQTSIRAIEQRVRICHELLDRKPRDLFLTVLGETHSALHDLWAASHSDHPLHACWKGDHDPLLHFFRAVDRAVGELIERAGPEAAFVLFSVHGMQHNATDLACLFFLSELLYRFNFPGRIGFAQGEVGTVPPPPVRGGLHWYWFGEMWRRKFTRVPLLRHLPAWYRWKLPGGDFRFPFFMSLTGPEAGWLPAMWYRPSWPRSRSFALPAFADGHVRINLAGREAHGIVKPHEYDDECDKIAAFLSRLRNPRTGSLLVREVVRTRKSPLDNDPGLPLCDLLVVWGEEPFDVLDSPDVGRIGPVPYFRTGGHRAGGFAMIKSPDLSPAEHHESIDVRDLAPTILDLLGAPIPRHLEGHSLLAKLCHAEAVS